MRLAVLSAVILSWIVSSLTIQAATSCSREFEFLGATNELEPMIWIGKRVGGECYYSSLITIALTDSGAKVKGSSGDFEFDYSAAKAVLLRFRQLQTTTYKVTQPHCTVVADNCCLGTTERAPELLDSLNKLIGDGEVVEAARWENIMAQAGIEIPATSGCRVELAAFDPGGLYVGYEIERMFTFESLPYVLLFTRQRRLDFGLDQLHGFLLLKIVAGEEQ